MMFTLAHIQGGPQTPEGWQSFVQGMQKAFATDTRELLILALALGLVLLFVVNVRIMRRVERSLGRRSEPRRLTHPPRDGRRTG